MKVHIRKSEGKPSLVYFTIKTMQVSFFFKDFIASIITCVTFLNFSANLEVEEECTAGRDTKCRCKEDHFCSSESCTICHPCKK